jgi:ribose transport system substrate-binding protein
VNGDWTPTTTKNVILQTLATNPAEVDAVWTSGSESRLVAEAFQESGREVPLVTGSISGDGLGYWRENPDGYRFTGNAVLPVPTANSAFRIAMRTLEGQGPKLNTLLVDLPKVTQADLPAWARDCMTPDSATVFPVAPADPYPEDVLDAYFENGAATPPYDYATTPDPCAAAG